MSLSPPSHRLVSLRACALSPRSVFSLSLHSVVLGGDTTLVCGFSKERLTSSIVECNFFFFFDSFIFEFLIGRKLSFPLFSETSNHLFLLLHEGLFFLRLLKSIFGLNLECGGRWLQATFIKELGL